MIKNDGLSVLHNEFDSLARDFARKTDAMYCEINPFYKGEECAQNLLCRLASVYYSSFSIDFRYTAHTTMNVASSIVECYVFLEKSESRIAIPLPIFTDICGLDIREPMVIPFITDAEGMREAFGSICGVLESLFDKLTRICNDDELRAQVMNAYFGEVAQILDLKKKDTEGTSILVYINPALYDFFTLRLSSAPFINYIKGDAKNARKQLKKTKNRLGYEERMLSVIPDTDTCEVTLPRAAEVLSSYNKDGVPKNTSRELLSMMLGWLVFTVAFTLAYSVIYLIPVLIESIDAFYVMGAYENIPFVICGAFLTSIVASYFSRKIFYKLLYPKDYDRYCKLDTVQNTNKELRLMRGMLTVIAALSIVGSILMSRWGIVFREEGFVDNTDFFSLSGEYHDYAEIDRVYYKPDRINGLGETIPFPSYVIVLDDGTEIDMYEYDDTENYENTLIEFLKSKGVKTE